MFGMVKNNRNNFLYNMVGLILLLLGTSLFYTGIKGLLIEYVTANPLNQFVIGLIMLGISYKIFNKKINFLG